MNNLFIIDGTSGIWKADLIEYLNNYLTDSTIIKKITTREIKKNEDENKLDLMFIKEEEFSRIAPEYHYTYNKQKYGFMRKDLNEALMKYKNVFIVIRNHDTINLIKKEYKNYNVIIAFIYTEVSEITKRLNLTANKSEKESVKQAFQDYLRNPNLYDKVIINGCTANDFYRLIDMLITCCSNETISNINRDSNNNFFLFIPKRLKIILGLIFGAFLPFLIGLIVNMITQTEWGYWKYISFTMTILFLLVVLILEYFILFESDKPEK